MENMPWPNTLGRPAALAATSSVCIGLKSPDAPAYMTRSDRVSLWVLAGASSPTFTDPASNRSDIPAPFDLRAVGSPEPYLTRVSGSRRSFGPAAAHQVFR